MRTWPEMAGEASRPGMAGEDLRTRVRQGLVLFVQPFFYGAATRLPFIYFVIHLDEHFGERISDIFGSKWFPIGCFVAAYQFSRVLTNVLSLTAPRLSHVIGTTVGLAGFTITFATDKDNLECFVTGTVLVGFSETMSSMQIYCKQEYLAESDLLQQKLKVQYAAVMLGVMLAFLLGGVLYQFFHINGVALFGMAVLGTELVATLGYLAIAQNRESEDRPASIEGQVLALTDLSSGKASLRPSPPPSPPGVLQGSLVPFRTSLMSQLSGVSVSFFRQPIGQQINEFQRSGQPANSLAYLLAITMGIEAVTIGYNLSVGPIFLLQDFGQGVAIIGVLFAAGATSGTFFAITATLTPWGKRIMKMYLPAPFNIYFSLFGIGACVLLASTPHIAVHIFGLLLLMGFNDLAATLLIELQGTVTSNASYKIVGPFGQVVRRTCNTVTAITGPLLFGVWPRLPYMVAGGVTLAWTLVVAIFIENRRKRGTAYLKENLLAPEFKALMRMSWEYQEIALQVLASRGAEACATQVSRMSLLSARDATILSHSSSSVTNLIEGSYSYGFTSSPC